MGRRNSFRHLWPALLVVAFPLLFGMAAPTQGPARSVVSSAPRLRLQAAAKTGDYEISTVADSLGRLQGIALDPQGSIVFTQNGTGTPATASAVVAKIDPDTRELRLLYSGQGAVAQVAVDQSGNTYWASPSAAVILRLPAGGERPAAIVDGLENPSGISVDGQGRLYFTEVPVGGASAAISAVSRFDGRATSVLRSAEAEPMSVAVSRGGEVYWTASAGGEIMRLAANGATTSMFSELERPVGIAVDPEGTLVAYTEVPTPGVDGAAGGRNAVTLVDLRTNQRTVIDRGDPEPVAVAVGRDGTVVWASATRGRVMMARPRRRIDRFCGLENESGGGSRGNGLMRARVSLTGAAVVPPVDTTATGTACFALNPGTGGTVGGPGARLDFNLATDGVSGSATADLHLGPPGAGGPSVAFLFNLPNVSGESERGRLRHGAGTVRPADLVGPLMGDWNGFVTAFRDGQIYVDVDTTADPDGLIRGKIVPPGGGNLPPRAEITRPRHDLTVATEQPVHFAGEASDPDGDMVPVLWDFGDDSTSTALAPPDHPYATPGTYTVTLTATDSRGLSDPKPPHRTIRVMGTPGPTPTPTPTPTPPPGSTPTPTPTPTQVPGNNTLTFVQASVFTPRCTGCHGAMGGAAGLDLSAGHSYANLVNVPATTQTGIRVVPGDPAASVLVTKLASGHAAVPAPLRTDIADWITAGALNN